MIIIQHNLAMKTGVQMYIKFSCFSTKKIFFMKDKILILIWLKKQLSDIHEKQWLLAISNKPKLRTYKTFKETTNVENYIKYNLTTSERSLTAQLRFGILPLTIETGQFRNIKLEERLCTLCQHREIKDEYHFLFHCS